mmetsp:Transcript_58198/g.107462  ORF Transcript_58198/g.107462 Transcript_58198/m.107462 type:complete len:202 (-) Transcript_58198:117-722(-)
MRATFITALWASALDVPLLSVAVAATSCQLFASGFNPIPLCLNAAMARRSRAQGSRSTSESLSSTGMRFFCAFDQDMILSASSTTTTSNCSTAVRHALCVALSSSNSTMCLGVATNTVPRGTLLSTSRRRKQTESARRGPTIPRMRAHICTCRSGFGTKMSILNWLPLLCCCRACSLCRRGKRNARVFPVPVGDCITTDSP